MPVSMTKNQKSRVQLEHMMQQACPNSPVKILNELTEGYFNAAYEVTLQNGKQVILKIAPPPDVSVMRYEKDLMAAEVGAMRLVAEQTDCPVAKILFFDQSRTLCDSDYFVMEKLPGKSFSVLQEQLTEAEKCHIQFSAGVFNRKLNAISGERFGCFAQPEKQYTAWFPAFKSLLQDVFADAEQVSASFSVKPQLLLELLERDKSCFEQVTCPQLVHWDLWAGNIFVDNGEISGLIDFERSLWGDFLMEAGFRSWQQEPAFLRGYGLQELTLAQQIRVLWYDVYLLLINSLECDYRHYETREIFHWVSKMLLETVQKLGSK